MYRQFKSNLSYHFKIISSCLSHLLVFCKHFLFNETHGNHKYTYPSAILLYYLDLLLFAHEQKNKQLLKAQHISNCVYKIQFFSN